MESKSVQKGGQTFHKHQNGESEYAKGKEDHIKRNVAFWNCLNKVVFRKGFLTRNAIHAESIFKHLANKVDILPPVIVLPYPRALLTAGHAPVRVPTAEGRRLCAKRNQGHTEISPKSKCLFPFPTSMV